MWNEGCYDQGEKKVKALYKILLSANGTDTVFQKLVLEHFCGLKNFIPV